jgi:ligand-binding SRPBCC domain-containing protein
VIFDLARDVDAHLYSAITTDERVIGGRQHGPMDLGDEVTWEATHFGLRQRLTVRIGRIDPPREFEDVMIRGAFRSMRHVHRFPPRAGGTLMVDDFHYTAPFGLIGAVVAAVILTPYLTRFLRTRAAALKTMAESRARA